MLASLILFEFAQVRLLSGTGNCFSQHGPTSLLARFFVFYNALTGGTWQAAMEREASQKKEQTKQREDTERRQQQEKEREESKAALEAIAKAAAAEVKVSNAASASFSGSSIL